VSTLIEDDLERAREEVKMLQEEIGNQKLKLESAEFQMH